MSGIRTLPLVLAVIGFAVAAGIGVSRIGYLPPFMFGATIMTSIGAGLLYTLNPTISMGKWIGYQIIYGSGSGVAVQQAISGVQLALPAADVAYGTSAIMTVNIIGGAVFICVAQSVFLGEVGQVTERLPNVDPEALQNGFGDLRASLQPDEVDILVTAYNAGISKVFLVVMVLCCASVLTWPFLSWKSIKKEKSVRKVDSEDEEKAGAG